MQDFTLRKEVSEFFQPFFDELTENFVENIHSVTIIGSALTEDFDEKHSDINSILTLHKMDLKFLEDFAPLGKKFGKKRIAAPLIMTPDYISSSLDVFPVEFLNIKLVHQTVFGEDPFHNIQINKADLRHQCERELKIKLIDLRQGYLSSLGDSKRLTQGFIDSISGYIPLFRSIIFLLGQTPPKNNEDVVKTLGITSNIDTHVFMDVLREKQKRIKLSMEQLNAIFENYYNAIGKLGTLVDEIEV